jgi:hypothetical protein
MEKDNLRIDKGPSEVLRALISGDESQLREALQFQRESFKTKFGCYPEDLVEVDTELEFKNEQKEEA